MHDEAEVLEHAIRDRLLASIDERLGHPDRDPHGDPIPAADGSVRREKAVLLDEAEDGHTGAILRISDRDPSLLRALEASGIGVGTTVSVDPGALTTGSTRFPLPAPARTAIWLSA